MNLYQLIKSTIRWISVSQCTRLLLVFVLGLTLCLFNNCGGGSAIGGSGGDEPAFEEGPIDIPITIAKGIDGVDPATVEYDVDTGILNACTVNRTDARILGFKDGTEVCDTETINGCFECLGIIPRTTIGLVALNEDETAGSYPVIVYIAADGSMKVGVTNFASLSTSAKFAVKSDGAVAFCATDSTGSPMIGTTTTSGGYPETFAAVDACPELVDYADSSLITRNTTSNAVVSYNTSGSSALLGTAYSTTPNIKSCPTGDVGFLTDATTISLNGSEATCPDEGANVASQIFDCLNSSTLISFQTTNSGSYQQEQCDVSDVVSALVMGDVPLKFLATTPLNCGHVTCNGDDVCFAECDDGSGENNLYAYNAVDNTNEGPRVSLDVDSGTSSVGSGGDAIAFTVDSNICFYDVTGDRTSCSYLEGISLRIVPSNNECVIYIGTIGGTNQILLTCFDIYTGEYAGDDDDDAVPGDDDDDVPATTATRLLISGSSSVTAGACTEYACTSRDGDGNAANVVVDTQINWSGAEDGAFYSDAACITLTTSTTIPAGSSSTTVYYYNETAPQSVNLTATDATTSLGSDSHKLNVNVGSPSKLFVDANSEVLVKETCSALSYIKVQDAYGNDTVAASATTVNLSETAGLGCTYHFEFTCLGSTTIETCSIPKGSNSCDIYYKCTTAGTATLRSVDNAGVLATDTQDVTITN